MAGKKQSMSTDADIHALPKEWDDVSCPICMDHPHNAVLLLCSSHEMGCRSYICDTSYRHANCLDRFKRLGANLPNTSSQPSSSTTNQSYSSNASIVNLGLRLGIDSTEAHGNGNPNEGNGLLSVRIPRRSGENNIQDTDGYSAIQRGGIFETGNAESLVEGAEPEELNAENSSELSLSLTCPLCRGAVLGWKVVEEARESLNLKPRSCSRESCSFSGNYRELRQHARRVHPTTRPADIDPSRERSWRRLEHQREHGDIISAIRSAMPGAIVLGDYAIESEDMLAGGRESGNEEGNGPWWTTFFWFQMIGSINSAAEPRSRSRALTRRRQSARAALTRRRFLWGENLLGLQDDDDVDDVGEDASPVPRRRRRLMRSESNEDQS